MFYEVDTLEREPPKWRRGEKATRKGPMVFHNLGTLWNDGLHRLEQVRKPKVMM